MLVARHHGAGIAKRAEVLAGIEAEGGRMAERARAAPLVARTVRLAGVLEHEQAVAVGDGGDLVHGRRLAVEVHGHDGFRPLADRILQRARVEVEGLRIRVDEHRGGSGTHDRERGRHERVGRRDHLVTGADATCAERQVESRQAGVGADRSGRPAVGRELLLEGCDVLPEDPVVPIETATDCLVDLARDPRPLGREINEGNSQAPSLSCRPRSSRCGREHPRWQPTRRSPPSRGRRRAPGRHP